jgi:hypothetical protein
MKTVVDKRLSRDERFIQGFSQLARSKFSAISSK